MRVTDRLPEGWTLIADDTTHPDDPTVRGRLLVLVDHGTHRYALTEDLVPVPRDWADRQLLERMLQASGTSLRQWAEQDLLRDERTVRRWRAGDRPVPPPVVRGWLRQMQQQ